jgi:hypothetical protein
MVDLPRGIVSILFTDSDHGGRQYPAQARPSRKK